MMLCRFLIGLFHYTVPAQHYSTQHTFLVIALGVVPGTCYDFSHLLWPGSLRAEPTPKRDVNRLTATDWSERAFASTKRFGQHARESTLPVSSQVNV